MKRRAQITEVNGAQSNSINFKMIKCRVINLGTNNSRISLPTSVEQAEVQHNPQLEAER